MKEYYTHKSSLISQCSLMLALTLAIIGGFTSSLVCIVITFAAALIGSYISSHIPASFEADDEKVTFVKGIIKKSIDYKDIKSIRCEVVKDGYIMIAGEMLYALELVIIIKGEDEFKTSTRFDVTTDMILHEPKEYKKLVNEHKFTRLKKYIDDKRS